MSRLAPLLALVLLAAAGAGAPPRPFGIRLVDAETGRGVPLVELETTHNVVRVTDSAGWAAIDEPDLNGRKVFFFVRSHGYEFPKDGFGFAGRAVEVAPGGKVEWKIRRKNVAERLYRATGQGIYRDSALLGEPTPLAEPQGAGRVAGQDSAFAELYGGKVFWFWGDTNRLAYPLGHYWMAGAVSELPGRGGLDPAVGVNYRYFADKEGFSRPLARLGVEKGPVWADGFLTLADPTGRERLVCHYAHVESLAKMLDHGLAAYDDAREEFVRLRPLDMKDLWRFPGQAHPFRHREGDVEHVYFGEVFPTVRVRAEWRAWLDPASYEGFGRAADGSRYAWRTAPPETAAAEKKRLDAGTLKLADAHFLPVDVDSGKPVLMHRGTVRWNEHRKRWVLIAGQIGGTSNLGEIWCSEADAPTGPWRKAKKIVTHDRYSFYNPVHHAFFDGDGGRRIYFEGTYTQSFSGAPRATPRYEYNQIVYRLDLDDPRLADVQGRASGR